MELTRERALALHREMWGDMQKELGNRPSQTERTEFKISWCSTHFPTQDINAHCFLCEYIMQNGFGCNKCPIDWTGRGGDGAILIKYGGEYKIFCGTAWCDAQFGWCNDKEHVIKSWNYRSDDMVDNKKNKTREARWIINSDGYYPYCSACMVEPQNGEMTDYCPNCGAKMKRRTDE